MGIEIEMIFWLFYSRDHWDGKMDNDLNTPCETAYFPNA